MKLRKLEDHDLVAQYRSGNEQAFEVLIRRHQKRIFLQIYSKVQDSEMILIGTNSFHPLKDKI